MTHMGLVYMRQSNVSVWPWAPRSQLAMDCDVGVRGLHGVVEDLVVLCIVGVAAVLHAGPP